MHLRDRNQHPVAAGVTQVEIILRRAEDRLGAQAEILSDAVHGVNDVIADAQVGQRDRNAFFDGAHLDAFGRSAEDLAIAEHAQAKARNAKPGFDRAVLDEHAAARARLRSQLRPRRNRSIVRETAALTM